MSRSAKSSLVLCWSLLLSSVPKILDFVFQQCVQHFCHKKKKKGVGKSVTRVRRTRADPLCKCAISYCGHAPSPPGVTAVFALRVKVAAEKLDQRRTCWTTEVPVPVGRHLGLTMVAPHHRFGWGFRIKTDTTVKKFRPCGALFGNKAYLDFFLVLVGFEVRGREAASPRSGPIAF